ncbi:MAG TPA: UDP-N-acetylmuramoyl-L-alanyl-D-glutamate--2,6-diaminopimelate ligase [Smithellaceae bacterium]|nr:UDP-N-acetylmuramoyl-L-alanyl-D-glutamate--2,6-diaminopimelate ligase [Smithellaceae bacterium]
MMQLRRLLQGVRTLQTETDPKGDVSSVCYVADACGPGSLFVAIPGLAFDGHQFINRAIERGARFIVHQKDIVVPEGVKAIQVPDSRRALGMLAKNYFGDPSSRLTLIGITGTSGKTTVSYLLESVLTAAGFSCGVLGTINYRYGGRQFPAPNTTPESFDMQRILSEMAGAGVTHVIAEVSSHALDLKRVDDCDFDLAVFTNLSPEHLDYHRDMEAYYRAKKRLFAELLSQSQKNLPRKAVINADDPRGRQLLCEISVPALSYSLEQDGGVRAQNPVVTLGGIQADLLLDGERIPVTSALIGAFNLSNILAAAAAASVLGAGPRAIAEGVRNLSFVPGRLERVVPSGGVHVFVDYAHKPDALEQVLRSLHGLKEKRILTVFGCGGNRDRAKRPVMGGIATAWSDLTIVTSDNPRKEDPLDIIREIEAGIDGASIQKVPPDRLEWDAAAHAYAVLADRRAAIEAAVGIALPQDIVLIAGKGHEDYQILGTKKVPFDDRLAAARALRLKWPAWMSPAFSLAEVLEATGGRLAAGERDQAVYGVSTDSRQIRPGNLFVALAGENFDGHAFVPRAVEEGAQCVLVADVGRINSKSLPRRVAVIETADTLRALGDLAHAHRRRFSIPVIALTGSSGKTTTREMLFSILRQEKTVLQTEGNLNNLIGLPQTLFRMTDRHDAAVLEMGTNTRGEIKRLTEIAAPDIGLITNVGPAHLAGFGSVETVREEKGDLWLHMNPAGVAVVNLDDGAVREAADRWNGKRVTFSMSAGADVGVNDIRKNGARGVSFQLLMNGKAHKVDMKVAGIHNIYNAMAAAAGALACGVSAESIRRGLSMFHPVAGRMEILRLQNGAYLINDAYNANPASVREALLTLKDLANSHSAFVLLGDMLELGDAAQEMHRKIGLLLATIGVAAVFLQGDFARATAAGALEGGLAEERIRMLQEDEEAVAFLKKKLRKGDWVLVKGSRRMKMERLAARLGEEIGVEKAEDPTAL